MIVRERLTGLRPPKNAEKIVDLWRPWIEERAAASSLTGLSSQIEDQRAFAVAVHKVLTALEMVDEGSLDSDPEEERTPRASPMGAEDERSPRTAPRITPATRAGAKPSRLPPNGWKKAKSTPPTRQPVNSRRRPSLAPPRKPGDPRRPLPPARAEPRASDYKAFTQQI